MTNRAKVLNALSSQSDLCDDCLSTASGVRPRQTVYAVCKALAEEGVISRHDGLCGHCHKTKLTSRLDARTTAVRNQSASQPHDTMKLEDRPWYWEGNVQQQVVSYLTNNRYTVLNVADTASREAGKDIVATSPDGSELWVSVKGYPERSPNVQARHWFSDALFDLVLYHGQDPNAKLALALPEGFVTYANLLPRVHWLKQSMPFQVYWVSEGGSVRLE